MTMHHKLFCAKSLAEISLIHGAPGSDSGAVQVDASTLMLASRFILQVSLR